MAARCCCTQSARGTCNACLATVLACPLSIHCNGPHQYAPRACLCAFAPALVHLSCSLALQVCWPVHYRDRIFLSDISCRSALLIQSMWRMSRYRRPFLRARAAAVCIQAAIRGQQTRKRYAALLQQIQAAVRIQAAFRGHLQRQEYKRLKRDAVTIQVGWRWKRPANSACRLCADAPVMLILHYLYLLPILCAAGLAAAFQFRAC